jgi:hypothetical protein
MKTRLALVLLPLCLCFFGTAKAQTDSSYYDLGHVLVKKDFTQSITIKASDLERYQFNNITDAVDVFFSGTFTNSSSVVYVIDGIIVNDVNAYSIHDIEEITLVQSSVAQASGVSPGQQMILIKTRTHRPGKQGIEAAGQTSIVSPRNNDNVPDAKKPTGIYNQYYVGAYKNYNNADVGVSADFLHDLMPYAVPNTVTSYDPLRFNRFKLNGYADVKLWKGSSLGFAANYTPQVSNYSYVSNNSTANETAQLAYGDHVSQHLINTTLTLRSHIVDGLTNTLTGGFNHYNYFETDTALESYTYPGETPNNTYYRTHTAELMRTWLIKDNLLYHKKIGDWSFDPMVNFTFRSVKDSLINTTVAYENNGFLGPGTPAEATEYYQGGKYKVYLLTPSLNIYYKDIFDIQGGATGWLNSEKGATSTDKPGRFSPFISTSLNIAALAGLNNVKLQIFGSYARQNNLIDDNYASLNGFTLLGGNNILVQTGSSAPIQYSSLNPYQYYNTYQAGLIFGLLKNLTLSYNFSENYYFGLVEYEAPDGTNGSTISESYYNNKFITNRFGLNYSFHSSNFNWQTGLNATETKLVVVDVPNGPETSPYSSYLDAGHRWTGGFTNRLAYKSLFAGVDVLYQLGERPYSLEYWLPNGPGYMPPSNKNSFSLQNLYVGTRLKIAQLQYAEIYIDTRNIIQNKSSDITDERRLYGLGFKLDL